MLKGVKPKIGERGAPPLRMRLLADPKKHALYHMCYPTPVSQLTVFTD